MDNANETWLFDYCAPCVEYQAKLFYYFVLNVALEMYKLLDNPDYSRLVQSIYFDQLLLTIFFVLEDIQVAG